MSFFLIKILFITGFMLDAIPIHGENITIVILREKQQNNLIDVFSNILKTIERSDQKTIYLRHIVFNNDNVDESLDELCTALSSEFNLIIDTTLNLLWPGMINLLREMNVPYLHVDLSLRPFIRAFLHYIDQMQTFDAAFIFNSENEQNEGIYEIISKSKYRSITFYGINETTSEKIRNLRPMPTNFVILAHNNDIELLFKQAIRSNIITRPNRWRILFLDFPDMMLVERIFEKFPKITCLLPTNEMCEDYLGANFNNSSNPECYRKITITEVLLEDLLTKLVTVLSANYFETFSINCNSSEYENNLRSNGDIEKTMFENKFYNQIVSTSTLIKLVANSSYNMEYYFSIMAVVGDIKEADKSVVTMNTAVINNEGLTMTLNITIKPPKRFFRIGIAPAIPWSYMKINPKTSQPLSDDTGKIMWEGYCIDFASKLAEILDFDYELIPTSKGTFGDRIPHMNNTWDGLVGDLMVGDIDIAVSAMKMTAEREEVIDFVAPYFEQTGILIVIRKPVRQTSLFKFMTVLRLEVWLSIVGAIISTAIMLWALDKYSPYSAKNNKKSYPYECRNFTFKESLWFAMTSFTPQGGGEAPKSLSSRTLVASYWLFVVLMLATFTANLAAFLTVERMQTPVQSLDQLARQSRINYTVVKGSDTHKYFINMKFAEDTLYRMWKELTLNSTSDQIQYRVWDYPIKEQYGHILMAINSSNPVPDAAEGFYQVNKHTNADFAFIHDSAEIKYEISKSCNLTEVGEIFAEQPYALAIQQGSQLQDELSRSILELQKERFFELLQSKYWNHSAKSECPNSDESEGITLESLGGVFIATLFGLALAMITLFFEIVYYRQRERRSIANKILAEIDHNNTPPPSYNQDNINIRSDQINSKKKIKFNIFQKKDKQVTLGEKFVPSSLTNPSRISYISVYPRKSIHSSTH